MNKRKNPYEYFCCAADIMGLRGPDEALEVLLIRRLNPPFKNKWALPGGFLDRHESAATAARREFHEETRLVGKKFVEFGSFSDPKRDPRGRSVTIAFWTKVAMTAKAQGADDAREARWFSVRRLPPLAFDHDEMIHAGLAHYHHQRRCRLSRLR